MPSSPPSTSPPHSEIPPQKPIPAELADVNDREATELAPVGDSGDQRHIEASTTCNDENDNNTTTVVSRRSTVYSAQGKENALQRFWRHQISVTVAHDACRDHLALERTFLGYLRTSLALSVLGISIAQLFRLQHSEHPSSTMGFFVLAKPLAALFLIAATFVALLGGWRFWRQQNAVARGKVLAGGWELTAIGLVYLILTLLLFVLLLAVDITKEL